MSREVRGLARDIAPPAGRRRAPGTRRARAGGVGRGRGRGRGERAAERRLPDPQSGAARRFPTPGGS